MVSVQAMQGIEVLQDLQVMQDILVLTMSRKTCNTGSLAHTVTTCKYPQWWLETALSGPLCGASSCPGRDQGRRVRRQRARA